MDINIVVLTEVKYGKSQTDLIRDIITYAQQDYDIVEEADGVFGAFDSNVLFKSSQLNNCSLNSKDFVSILEQIDMEEIEYTEINEDCYEVEVNGTLYKIEKIN